ncbi:3-oxoacyl-ACP synthase III family protein [Gloeothece verrucosa]|uniref:3-Oxoacyl-(Acyl-carrier-protein (ACP)) synthase III domain protein n=1 Tax=Gloeothece verrucosa (strain PCC 7822) TaxID=497965 RepID=E0ULM6_GLOV7|nr:3-oxoacyl-[acyl-carrier-protein] synthase III C-terminal domain-containing protein [Gloeothece verrucosa]ADN17856.1 3-Oxoacyl-(acyl-carrier-protein (ACP)) synthase III domain protein [Gloeothece verrucosa PCC 7822]
MNFSVGIRSIGLSFPSIKRTNDYYKKNFSELVANAEQQNLAKLFSLTGSPTNEFDEEMMPYLSDPFRGTVERWILGTDESALNLQERAAKDALNAAQLTINDIDLMLVASIWPEQVGFGDAAFLAQKLGLQGAAWNLDGTCGVTPVALQTACSLVRTGEYDNVLVVISCCYSRFFDETDTLSWFTGDCAGAFLVGPINGNQGLLGTKAIHTSALANLVSAKLQSDAQGQLQIRMKLNKGANRAIRETAVGFLRTCSEGAMAEAGLSIEDIDFFLFNTSTAWLASFCSRVLGISSTKTFNLYPQIANIGPVITVANLYYAAKLGKIQENDLVFIYGFGAAGVAAASVIRWGNIALGPDPLSTAH